MLLLVALKYFCLFYDLQRVNSVVVASPHQHNLRVVALANHSQRLEVLNRCCPLAIGLLHNNSLLRLNSNSSVP